MLTDRHAPGRGYTGSGWWSEETQSLHRAVDLSGERWLMRITGPLDPLMAVVGGHTLE